jgi:hypothetical protein
MGYIYEGDAMSGHQAQRRPFRNLTIRVVVDLTLVFLATATALITAGLLNRCIRILVNDIHVVPRDSAWALFGFDFAVCTLWVVFNILILWRMYRRAGTLPRTLMIGSLFGAFYMVGSSQFLHSLSFWLWG